ncbi:MAG: hypothetical protein ACOZF0_22485 [Thermodesulfobacteriota bacterium]
MDFLESRRIFFSTSAKTALLHKNGHYVPILTRGFILRDANDKAVRISGTNTDLTERKRLEEEGRQLERQRRLLKAKSLDRMAGSIAHHFNNLLGVVMGNLELAMDDQPINAAAGGNLSEAMKAAKRAAELSGLMLTCPGQAAGKLKPIYISIGYHRWLPCASFPPVSR